MGSEIVVGIFLGDITFGKRADDGFLRTTPQRPYVYRTPAYAVYTRYTAPRTRTVYPRTPRTTLRGIPAYMHGIPAHCKGRANALLSAV